MQQVQDPVLISDEQAVNSITLLSMTFFMAIGTSASLSRRVRPAIRACFRSNTSSLLSHQAGANWSVQAGHRRVLAIFVSGLLHASACVNTIAYYGYLWKQPRQANAPLSYIADIVTIVPAGPLVGLAAAYRIALVLVTHPHTRRRLLVVTALFTMCMPVMFASFVIGGIVRNWHEDIVAWQNIVIYGLETGLTIMLFPILCIGASLWSVKAVLTQPTPAPATATTWEPDFQQRRLGDSEPNSNGNHIGTLNGATAPGPPNGKEGAHIASTASGRSEASQAVVLAQSLKSTFILLTLMQAVYWTLYLYVLILHPPMPFRTMSVTVALSTVACATEAGFEVILRKNRNLTMATNRSQTRSGLNNETSSVFSRARATMGSLAKSMSRGSMY